MKRQISAVGLAVFLVFSLITAPVQAQEVGSQKVVITLKQFTGNLHAVFMALKISNGLLQKGDEVSIFLNLEGVRLADKRQPQDLDWGHSKDLPQLFDSVVKNGGNVVVCPHCAKVAGMTKADLRDGAHLAEMDEVINMLHTADKIMDY